jgi:hypothetical protein
MKRDSLNDKNNNSTATHSPIQQRSYPAIKLKQIDISETEKNTYMYVQALKYKFLLAFIYNYLILLIVLFQLFFIYIFRQK